MDVVKEAVASNQIIQLNETCWFDVPKGLLAAGNLRKGASDFHTRVKVKIKYKDVDGCARF